MSVGSGRNAFRPAAYVARCVWGVALIAVPGRLLALAGGPDDRRGRATLRTLGGRHLLQAAMTGPHPRERVARVAAMVDSLHSVTALGLAVVDRRRTKVAAFDAMIAATWAWLDLGARGRVGLAGRSSP